MLCDCYLILLDFVTIVVLTTLVNDYTSFFQLCVSKPVLTYMNLLFTGMSATGSVEVRWPPPWSGAETVGVTAVTVQYCELHIVSRPAIAAGRDGQGEAEGAVGKKRLRENRASLDTYSQHTHVSRRR